MSSLTFTESTYYTCPPLTPEAVTAAEEALGVTLPRAYLEVLTRRNGGVPEENTFRTPFPTSWAPDSFAIRALLGIGGPQGIDSATGSPYLIQEWGYPPIGVVICECPSGGHDTVMLDYSVCGAEGEPSVAYVDEDRIPKTIASDFTSFISALTRT